MSKITFRADDELVRRLEEFDASKSEVMREALRAYLDDAERDADSAGTVEDAITERVDELVAQRVDERLSEFTPSETQDVNVNISLDGVREETAVTREERTADTDARKTPSANGPDPAQTGRNTCNQCGTEMAEDDVYCPNCGEKASHRVFCECGDELRSDWAFCPSCGRRTPAADVLDRP